MKKTIFSAVLMLVALSGCAESRPSLANINSVDMLNSKAGKTYISSLEEDDTYWFLNVVKECSWQVMDSDPKVPKTYFELNNDQKLALIAGVVGSNLVIGDESTLWECAVGDSARLRLLSFGKS
ncbi:hypothetical protein [Marinobacter sp. NFXS9]|uniref:hypothetical protein n=1 Tax=Marinobacter sp. NFXS9 TaxID=2818433 RepID=UPI0032DFA616